MTFDIIARRENTFVSNLFFFCFLFFSVLNHNINRFREGGEALNAKQRLIDDKRDREKIKETVGHLVSIFSLPSKLRNQATHRNISHNEPISEVRKYDVITIPYCIHFFFLLWVLQLQSDDIFDLLGYESRIQDWPSFKVGGTWWKVGSLRMVSWVLH